MAEEKPFEASAQRLRQARSDGDHPKMAELLSLAAYAGSGITLSGLLPNIAAQAANMLVTLPTHISVFVRDGQSSGVAAVVVLFPLLIALAASICMLMLVAVGSTIGVALAAGMVNITPVRVRWSVISPGPALQRMFSRESAATALRMCGIAALSCVAVAPSILRLADIAPQTVSLGVMIAAAWDALRRLLLMLGLIGLLFAGYEAWQHLRAWRMKLRMSFTEIRREAREQSGDPQQKSQRRRTHRRLTKSGIKQVKRATLVVTNPTHFAVALIYDPPTFAIPVVVARGADEAAQAIRREAEAEHIPLIEHIELARLLFARCAEGDPIPLESYALAAPIIATVLAKATK